MKRIVAKALAEAGIPELADREVTTLSGGQKQRAGLAGLLALVPGLCERGISVVLISHDPRELAAADSLVLFRDGAVAAQDSPAALLSQHELLASCGLEA